MTLLARYLTRNNAFLIMCMLGAGVGIYLLVDIFDRMDNFLEAGLGAGDIVMYFLYKIPMIISQILPAIFLLALVVQFCLMAKSRELTALNAGGISAMAFLRFALFYGLFWSCAQLAFSQALGVAGEMHAQRFWQETVQKREPDKPIEGIWFTEKNNIVHISSLYPVSQRGEGLLVYKLNEDGTELEEIINADEFRITRHGADELSDFDSLPEEARAAAKAADEKHRAYWLILHGSMVNTATFSYTPFTAMTLPLRQNMDAFVDAKRYGSKSVNNSLFSLYEAIRRLKNAGSNVEGLRTKFHAGIAYAMSLLVMSVLGLAIINKTTNIYLASCAALLLTFAFYTTVTVCNALGSNGKLPPPLAAWLPDILFFSLPVAYMLRNIIKNRQGAD